MKRSLHAARALASAFLLPLSLPSPGAGPPPLRLYYYERPPFHYTDEQGRVVGTIAAATEETLRRAGLRFRWEPMPANRILSTLRTETPASCSPGWYSTPERRVDLLFSRPTLRDKPLIGLMRADFPVEPGITARSFFALPHVRLLVKQNFSQGAFMNGLIAQMPAEQVQRVAQDVPQMVRMLRANRADVIITTEAEAALFVQAAGFTMQEFRIVRFPDVPEEESRYIVCGPGLERETMARIDRAILPEAVSRP